MIEGSLIFLWSGLLVELVVLGNVLGRGVVDVETLCCLLDGAAFGAENHFD